MHIQDEASSSSRSICSRLKAGVGRVSIITQRCSNDWHHPPCQSTPPAPTRCLHAQGTAPGTAHFLSHDWRDGRGSCTDSGDAAWRYGFRLAIAD